MKRIAFTALLSILVVTAWLVAKKQSTRPAQGREFFCPMHPEYGSSVPGNCPVCGMGLVSSRAKAAVPIVVDRVPVSMTAEQQRAIGVALTEARVLLLGKTIHAAGRVSLSSPEQMPSSEAGTVEEVFRMPSSTGALRLRAGEPILSFNGGIVRAPAALALLTVTQPGQRVEQGKSLFVYTGLATIFVVADLRSTDIPFLETGRSARATLPAYPGRVWHGSVLDTAPQFDDRAQTLKVRLQFSNNEPEIWPGLLATVEIASRKAAALAVPESSVITDGETSLVFVARPDHIFEPRQIETGVRTESMVEVKRGLSPGDRVATAGTFLLDSESRLRALTAAGSRR